MTPAAAQAEHIAMSGGGAGGYSLVTRGAGQVIDAATPLVIGAIDRMAPRPDCARFSIMDMGCADGGTSLRMLGAAVRRVRGIARGADISITYADQPRNDFNALVNIVHGRGPFATYVDDFAGVYPLFSANSFYLQALPSATLNLGFSATAMHWLSAKPADLAEHVHAVGASGAELSAYAAQAAADWETILLHRARELVSGGRLVLVNFCIDERGRYLGNTDVDGGGGANMFEVFNQIWRRFMADGRITAPEYTAMTLPQYYRTMAEFAAPLRDPASACHRAGLRLETMETRVVPCPFAEEFKVHGDVEKFADGLMPTLRSWNESIFAAALRADRPPAERAAIIDDYYAAYRAQVVRQPQRHGMGYVHAYKTIRKI